MVHNFIHPHFAKRLKAIGYNEPCIAYYEAKEKLEEPIIGSYEGKKSFEYILAPTYTELFEWFKVNFNILVHPIFEVNRFGEDFIPENWSYKTHYRNKFNDNKWWCVSASGPNAYYTAVKTAIELIEQGNIVK